MSDWLEHFLSRIDIGHPDACWEWQKMRRAGYGRVRSGTRMWEAHRVAWEVHFGDEIPAKLHVCHSCDNPACCNPSHLWLGTSADNMGDRERKGRGRQPSGDNHRSRKHPETVLRGSQHGMARLSEKDIPGIRLMRARGNTWQSIGDAYGVGMNTVRNVCIGRTWKHVP